MWEERFKSTKYRFLGRLNVVTDNTVIITDSQGRITPLLEIGHQCFTAIKVHHPKTHIIGFTSIVLTEW